MLEQQASKCALCDIAFGEDADNRPAVDHCHATKKVRGLLCKPCNTMLGRLADDVDWMRRAIAYLEVPRE